MRAAIYARFSTDLQSAASIDDQVRVCRERIEQDGHRGGSGLHGPRHLGGQPRQTRHPILDGRCRQRRV